MKIIEITSGFEHSMALDQNNELYIWGNNRDSQLGINSGGDKIHKLDLPNLKNKSTIWPICGSWNSFVIFNRKTKLDNEFLKLFENQIFFDFTLNGIKAHKILVESRTGKNIDEITKLVESRLTKEETTIFLRWVYGDTTKNHSAILKNILKSLNTLQNLNLPFSKTLEQLFADENSKNFILYVKIDDDDNENEEEEEILEEIPVHKFILQAKSGLFREMFKNVTEKSNSVTDYSGKTIESIEILIKFFYLNRIELTADDDPQLLAEELEDAFDYYQLSKNSNFQNEYGKIKNIYN
ncbi:btk-binding protein-related [Anaeramoeba flamelloides]|uniref:Btk-binding protein-related n=1 Tax=Anaeramoeba flamelloides TaxID=1746091 RepID=A0ABQ8YIH6_9EUKA|nr:btk-binding protein-related [Anaeramoeba flamelloides]